MLALKGAFSSFPERIDGQNLSAINEAIITIANQVRLWAAEEYWLPEPFQSFGNALPVAIFILISVGILEELLFYRLISGNRRLDRRLGQLRFQTELAAQVTVQLAVETLVGHVKSVVEDVLRHEVTSLTVLFRHLTEQRLLFGSNVYTKFYCFS